MSKLLAIVVLMGLTGVAAADPGDAETIHRVLATWIETHPIADHLDVSIVSVDVVTCDDRVDVKAQIRIALSDARGQIKSVLSGTAKASVSAHRFHARDLPSLRDEALVGAMQGVLPKLHGSRPAAPFALLSQWLARAFTPVATS